MMYFIVSVYMWLLFLVTSIFFMIITCLIWFFTIPFDPKLRVLHYFSCFWASVYIWANPLWKVTLEGRKKIGKGPYVMICNHQSMADIIVLYRLFVPFKWVSKIELFKVPFVGWNMALNRYIAVDRGNRSTYTKMFKDCENNLTAGNSILLFPEGTRSKDGQLLTFKDGAVRMAQGAKVDILPIILDGTANTLPKTGFMLRSREAIHVKVLDPVAYESFAHTDSKAVAAQLQQMMGKQLAEMRTKAQKA
jgi:1-acyl-sn-glycerol-3-phosphate acyltransferase